MCDFCPPRFIVQLDALHDQCPHPYKEHGNVYEAVTRLVCAKPECDCLGTREETRWVGFGCLTGDCPCRRGSSDYDRTTTRLVEFHHAGYAPMTERVEFDAYGFPGKWSD